ncbi:MAG: DNA-3-methyladenine glycosylase 2 family protein [Caldilineaceae bacterium]|nr:DNA-3-methyladenine glycosylase 2 family protein [Caldilineaceae bacterium]MBP8106090.1 DNA-3-methyladenine glycosylase 2 family protein [Caldilineaceae bacterium]MBP8125786.1 DNA-3-methyladenine glycosylase 2 family protein [Caldilineaceae bacterium]MBP9074700.1 DNA-3-methyladenine glycosylase 2 family protein [Caldilineaceae bacterium]
MQTHPAPPNSLTPESYAHHITALCAADPDLAGVVDRFGPPPFWTREPGFVTLVHIILEQQVSLASAQAALDRLKIEADPLTPQSLLALDDETLRRVGFSRQKIRYARLLAHAVLTGELDLDGMAHLPDAEAQSALTALKGIGPWTADVYLLMALRRADMWPIGDRALVVAAREVKGLDHDPSAAEMGEIGEAWRPVRAVAARILWHHYLSR